MRDITEDTLREWLSESSNSVTLVLLDIDLGDETLRYVNNNETVEFPSGSGNMYQAYPFSIVLPDDTQTRKDVKLSISNVHPLIISKLREQTQRLPIIIRVVVFNWDEVNNIYKAPVEEQKLELLLKQYTANATTITGSLSYEEDFLNQRFPKERFTPQTAAGIFD